MARQLKINDKIRAKEVRLIGESGEQLGIMPLAEAQRIAREQDIDLVEVAPTASPPVCRLVDYGKFKYEQEKKEREARKSQKTTLLKEVRFTPKIDEHDLEFKTRTIQRFLAEGDKVKVTVRFKGREMAHPQLGRQVLQAVVKGLQGVGAIERMPAIEGRNMIMILMPAGGRKAEAAKMEAIT